MKISTIPSLYRNLRRWREILAVLRRYGLADWLSHYDRVPFRRWFKDQGGNPLAEYTRETRVRLALTELGPTFIKLGQVLAGRPDLVGVALSEELKRLRADVQPDTIEQVRQTMACELGEDYEEHFQFIDAEPLATASIGQVHRATLNDGTPVVIKVQRHGIERTVQQDIEVLGGLAVLAERVDVMAAWRPTDVVRQLAPIINRELDFERERQSLEFFSGWMEQHSEVVVVPKPFSDLCTKRILVMEELRGRSLASCLSKKTRPRRQEPEAPAPLDGLDLESDTVSDAEAFSTENAPVNDSSWFEFDKGLSDQKREEIAQQIADVYVAMIFDEGVYQADPHTGNLILLDDGRLGILDFGMSGRIDETLRETIEAMVIAISEGDQSRLTRLIQRVGETPAQLDQSALANDVADFVATYGQQSLDRFDLAGALTALTELLHYHSIKLPNQSALLLKTLISLEGTMSELGASFDSLQVIQEMARKSAMRRMSPRRRFRQVRRIYLEAEEFLATAPAEMVSLLQMVRRGETRVNLEHKRLSPSINRLVLGMMASAVFMGSALMLARDVKPLMSLKFFSFDSGPMSMLGLFGVVGSMSVMVWLLIAIAKSGHLTRDNED